MSTSTFLALGGMGAVVVGSIYTLREYYIPMQNGRTRDRERIQELEEEIVRLKREMRICGIRIASEDSKIAPGK